MRVIKRGVIDAFWESTKNPPFSKCIYVFFFFSGYVGVLFNYFFIIEMPS